MNGQITGAAATVNWNSERSSAAPFQECYTLELREDYALSKYVSKERKLCGFLFI